MMDFASLYASGSGFASADTRFHRQTSPAATAPLKSAPVKLRLSAGQPKRHASRSLR